METDTLVDSTVIDDPRQRAVVLAGVCFALVAVQASVGGLTIAVPAIAVDLQADSGAVLWVVNAYTLALAALLMPLGAIGDRIGRRPVLLAGLVVFGGACLGASQAGSVEVLIALRVLAGIGGAMILPATLSIITSSFPAEHRGTAVGVWAGCAGAGGMGGLAAAAVITDKLTWPWLFVMITVPAAVAFVLVLRTVPDSREGGNRPFDRWGALLSAAAIGGLVLAVQEGPERGWTDTLTLVGAVCGIAGLAGWVVASLRIPSPLFDLRLLRQPKVGGGSLGLVLLFAGNFGMGLVLIQYIILVLGFSPVKAATGIFPMGLAMVLVAPFSPRVAARFGTALTMTVGLSTAAVGLALVALQGDAQSFAALIPGLAFFGLGIGLAMTPATTAITEGLPLHQQGVASALNDTVRELGGALGIAVLGTLLNAGYRSSIGDVTVGLDPSLVPQIEDGLATAGAVAASLPAEIGLPILDGARAAFIDGFTASVWAGAGVLAVGAIASLLILRDPGPADD